MIYENTPFAHPAFVWVNIFCSPGQASTQTKRGLLPTDLSAIKEVSDAQISPDGSRVVYVVSEVAPDRSRTISRLWIVPTTGGEPKLLTKNDASETTPRWSPDGKWIAFYSSRDKKDGLWDCLRRRRRTEAGNLRRPHEFLSEQSGRKLHLVARQQTDRVPLFAGSLEPIRSERKRCGIATSWHPGPSPASAVARGNRKNCRSKSAK